MGRRVGWKARSTACAAVLVAVVAGCGSAGRAPPIALLTAVSAGTTAAGDRVTFAFRSQPRDVAVRYVTRSALTEDASGRAVRVAGSAFLVLRFGSASGFDLSRDEVVTTYRGPRRFTPRGTRVVREVVRLGDFEAVLTWAVGLTERRPYSVERSGHRVILEVR